MSDVVAERGEDRRYHRPGQSKEIEPAMSVDVAGLAEDRCGETVGQERSDHGPGQDRHRGMKLRRHRRQGDDEHGEREVQCEEPSQQRPQNPPLIARGRRRSFLHSLAKKENPVEITAGLTAQCAKGGARRIASCVEKAVGVFAVKMRQRALVAH